MQVEMKLTGIDGVLATLQSLPPEVVSKRGGPVKDALRKGALVILAAEKKNLVAVTSSATSSGRAETTGLLLKNLIASRGKPPASGKGERYLVRVKRVVYTVRPLGGGQRTTKEKTNTIANAQRLEYGAPGHNQPAEPFIRPAFLNNASKAIETITRELVASLDRVVKKLAAQNKGK